jgi:four helix bundle protein
MQWQFLQKCRGRSAKSGVIPLGRNHASTVGMTTIRSFRDLLVWQKSMDLAVRCYVLARRFPKADQAVLGYQAQKCAVSIPSNVSEGFARHSTPHYVQHLWTAHASGAELETQLELGKRVEVVTREEAEALIANAQEVGRMLNGLVRSLDRSASPDASLPEASCPRQP